VSQRWTFTQTPAIRAAGDLALELSVRTRDDLSLIDLYSCFPSAVQLGARSLGFGLERQLSRTGGLSFAGGPWNNYSMHAIATLTHELRETPSATGLVWANGGFASKHSVGIYSGRPNDRGFRWASPQADIDRLPQRVAASEEDAAGPVTIEAYTVMHDRDGQPERAVASALLADGRRAWATTERRDIAAAMTVGEWVGTEIHLTATGELVA
jgi:acetyl-CoA C-acetyltransferase